MKHDWVEEISDGELFGLGCNRCGMMLATPSRNLWEFFKKNPPQVECAGNLEELVFVRCGFCGLVHCKCVKLPGFRFIYYHKGWMPELLKIRILGKSWLITRTHGKR